MIKPVCGIAEKASRTILDVYLGKFTITQKKDFSPVTEADLAAHDIIADGLAELDSAIPLLSEEDASVSFAQRQAWDYYWLVDPLDGTREFIKKNGEFTINIALIHEQRAVLGVIYVPVTGVEYYAYWGGGAFKTAPNEAPQAIKSRQWDGKHITVAGSRSHRTEKFKAFLEGFYSYEVLSLGSSLKSCVVAEGRADVYARFGPTSEWDTAAAQCIIEEAGGRIIGLDQQPLLYNTKDSLLNPPFLAVGDARHDWASYVPD